jgi:hypothetical protein
MTSRTGTTEPRPLRPIHAERLSELAQKFGHARARQFLHTDTPAEQRELDRAADQAWADYLRELHALVNWSHP